MEREIQRRSRVCEAAENPDWEDVVALSGLDAAQRAFLTEHPPGLVRALWKHFDATRDACGCKSPTHERPECTVRFIERLLLDEQSL